MSGEQGRRWCGEVNYCVMTSMNDTVRLIRSRSALCGVSEANRGLLPRDFSRLVTTAPLSKFNHCIEFHSAFLSNH